MKQDENIIKEYFKNKNLRVERFSEAEMKNQTPDFKVYCGNALVFYCEVKSIFGDDFEGSRNDPTYNKIQNKVYEAIKQFNSINPDNEYPNILALVNHELGTDERDLISIITGYFYCESGKRYPIFKKYSEGRIKEGKNAIDLYLWFERETVFQPKYLYKDNKSQNVNKLKILFESNSMK